MTVVKHRGYHPAYHPANPLLRAVAIVQRLPQAANA